MALDFPKTRHGMEQGAMKAATVFAAALAAASMVSCKSQIDYIGETHPQTSQIDYFFSKDDIKRPCKTMGKAIVSPGLFESASDMQSDLMEAARQKGADGVLVDSFNKVKTGENSTWNSAGYGKVKKHDDFWNETGSSHTSDQTELLITVFFIKYLPPETRK